MRENPKLQKTLMDGRTACCLPIEVLLNIVKCLDYNMLLALCFTSHTFHSVVQTNAGVLAKRLQMRVHVEDGGVILSDGEKRLELHCDSSMPSTYVAAMKRVARHVGFHGIETVNVENDWRLLTIDRLFYVSPALRFVKSLRINLVVSNARSFDDVNRLSEQFPHLRRVHLYGIGWPYFDWCAFLQSEDARKLPELVLDGPINHFTRRDGSISEPKEYDFLQYCFDCSRLAEGVGRSVKLPLTFTVTRSFLVTALRRIAKADRTTTVQFAMWEEPNLPVDRFSIHQMEQLERNVTHYKSRTSSVSVYQQHRFFTVTNDPAFCPFVIDD